MHLFQFREIPVLDPLGQGIYLPLNPGFYNNLDKTWIA
jgi:hypothetical protein